MSLYRKYDVKRLRDPQNKHGQCHFFVLDLTHDEFAAPALDAYAAACEAKRPELASDLRVMARTIRSSEEVDRG